MKGLSDRAHAEDTRRNHPRWPLISDTVHTPPVHQGFGDIFMVPALNLRYTYRTRTRTSTGKMTIILEPGNSLGRA